MPTLCCVPRCNGRGGHLFPNDQNLRKRWIIAVKRGENNWTPSRFTKVCHAHFSEDDYVTHSTSLGKLVDYLLAFP